MEQRTLGKSGLTVSAIGLGCMSLSGTYGPRDESECLRVLARARELGITFFDTANAYGNGHNEELIGRAFKGKFGDITLATKCGFVGAGVVDCSPAQIRTACDASLKRLGIDTIDLYYLHRADPKVPIEDSVGAMGELVRAGKVRHVGLSEITAPTLRRAVKEHPIAAVQSEYSLFTRIMEDEVIPACRVLGVGIVPFSPLGRGMLTGKIQSSADFAEKTDMRNVVSPRFDKDNLPANLKLVEKIKSVARARDATPGQVALAWVLAQGNDVSPIPGTGRVANLEENAGAASVKLTAPDLAALDTLARDVAGARYTARVGATVGVETPPRR